LAFVIMPFAMFLSIAIPFFVLHDLRSAAFFSVVSVLLLLVIGYKYRWYGFRTIPLEQLPSNFWIIRIANKRLTYILSLIFIAVLIGYMVIFIFNLGR